MSEEKKAENKKKRPLWLPEGSIRAILAIIIISSTIAMEFVGITPSEWLIGLVGMVIAFYFLSRAVETSEK